MTSPGRRPAFSAGPPVTTLSTTTPGGGALGGGAGSRGLHLDAQPAALDVAGLDDHFHDRARDRRGDGEAEAFGAAGAAGDLRVDPDDLALDIHQGPPTVSRVYGGVGLDEV